MEKLNSEQKSAVTAVPGTHLLLAGAGTGKTSTLVARARYLVETQNVDPSSVLLLTFSRKAAEEMASRIGIEGILSGTFHSVALKLLRSFGTKWLRQKGFPASPGILDDEGREGLYREIAASFLDRFRGIPLHLLQQSVGESHTLSRREQRMLESTGISAAMRELEDIYRVEKIRRGMLDFSDLLSMATDMIHEDASVRKELHGGYRHILVDEYQDTSDSNYIFLRALRGEGTSLFAVGDDWQSIYGFRNARVDYIINMKRYFSGTRTMKLQTNYRSYQGIVQAGNRFIRFNPRQTRKTLKAHRGKGGHVSVSVVESLNDEAERIIALSKKHGDVTVLCRTHRWGVLLREVLGDRQDISFLTIHASKGLEFDTVVVAGIKPHHFPHPGSSLDEERRLMYVAITRARDNLYLLTYGDGGEKGFSGELKSSV